MCLSILFFLSKASLCLQTGPPLKPNALTKPISGGFPPSLCHVCSATSARVAAATEEQGHDQRRSSPASPKPTPPRFEQAGPQGGILSERVQFWGCVCSYMAGHYPVPGCIFGCVLKLEVPKRHPPKGHPQNLLEFYLNFLNFTRILLEFYWNLTGILLEFS